MKSKRVEKDKWYVINCATAAVLAGPFDTERLADRQVPELQRTVEDWEKEEIVSMSGDDYLDES